MPENLITADCSLSGLPAGEQIAHSAFLESIEACKPSFPTDMQELQMQWDGLISAVCDDPCSEDSCKSEFHRYCLAHPPVYPPAKPTRAQRDRKIVLSENTPATLVGIAQLDTSLLPETYPGLSVTVSNNTVFVHQEGWSSIQNTLFDCIDHPCAGQWNTLLAIWRAVAPVIALEA